MNIRKKLIFIFERRARQAEKNGNKHGVDKAILNQLNQNHLDPPNAYAKEVIH